MSTSAPMRREYEIPIVEPYRVPVQPRRLPEPDPRRIAVPFAVPVKQPERVRV